MHRLAVTDLFTQNEVEVEKLIMFTGDGASIMLGCNNGMQAKLKSIVPHLMEYIPLCHPQGGTCSKPWVTGFQGKRERERELAKIAVIHRILHQ